MALANSEVLRRASARPWRVRAGLSGSGLILLAFVLLSSTLVGWFVILDARAMWRQMRSSQFVPVPATIVSAQATGRGPPRVEFEYEVNGVGFRSEREDFFRTWGLRRDATQTIARYPVGSVVSAYVDPSDPQRATLVRGLLPEHWASPMFLLGFVLAVVSGWAAVLRSIWLASSRNQLGGYVVSESDGRTVLCADRVYGSLLFTGILSAFLLVVVSVILIESVGPSAWMFGLEVGIGLLVSGLFFRWSHRFSETQSIIINWHTRKMLIAEVHGVTRACVLGIDGVTGVHAFVDPSVSNSDSEDRTPPWVVRMQTTKHVQGILAARGQGGGPDAELLAEFFAEQLGVPFLPPDQTSNKSA